MPTSTKILHVYVLKHIHMLTRTYTHRDTHTHNIYIYIYIYTSPLTKQLVFTKGPGNRGTIPGRVIPKT